MVGALPFGFPIAPAALRFSPAIERRGSSKKEGELSPPASSPRRRAEIFPLVCAGIV